MTLCNLEFRTDSTYKVKLRKGLDCRSDVLEDGTNILCRNVGDRLLVNAKQRNGKTNKGKGKAVPLEEGPRGFQEVKVPRFRDNGTGWW